MVENYSFLGMKLMKEIIKHCSKLHFTVAQPQLVFDLFLTFDKNFSYKKECGIKTPN